MEIDFRKRCKRVRQGNGAEFLFNVSICLLTLHPIPNAIFTFAPLGVVLKVYEDIEYHNLISNLKQFFG